MLPVLPSADQPASCRKPALNAAPSLNQHARSIPSSVTQSPSQTLRSVCAGDVLWDPGQTAFLAVPLVLVGEVRAMGERLETCRRLWTPWGRNPGLGWGGTAALRPAPSRLPAAAHRPVTGPAPQPFCRQGALLGRLLVPISQFRGTLALKIILRITYKQILEFPL